MILCRQINRCFQSRKCYFIVKNRVFFKKHKGDERHIMKDPITISDAKQELKIAERQNPGLWIAHSYHVGAAAKYIAEACKNARCGKKLIFAAFCMI